MCGIIFRYGKNPGKYIEKIRVAQALLRHRGPDKLKILLHEDAIMAFTRLSIVDQSADQPIVNYNMATMTNGEFYELEFFENYSNKTNCDSECVIPYYLAYGADFFKYLHGKFATVLLLLDSTLDIYYVGRDRMGICPLYWGRDEDDGMWFASEMKALVSAGIEPKIFPTGYYYRCFRYPSSLSSSIAGNGRGRIIGNWFEYHDYSLPLIASNESSGRIYDESILKRLLIDSVIMRIPTSSTTPSTTSSERNEEVGMGCLLSGGLDSSLVAAILKREVPNLNTFSIGFEDSTDLKAARQVADFLKTKHHEFKITLEEAFDAIPAVIYFLETYDITTIRAATPMFLMAKRIRELSSSLDSVGSERVIKVVFSGEGADELFAGYSYFKKAPNPQELQKELYRKVRLLHRYDCLRANKALMANSIEGRFPFLDQSFVKYVMSIDPSLKMLHSDKSEGNIEKYILRHAFTGYLPDDILWRKKEQFSDGVGYSWITYIKNKTAHIPLRQCFQAPWTPEGQYYRDIFDSYFPTEACAKTVLNDKSMACSTKKIAHWFEDFSKADPSGLLLD